MASKFTESADRDGVFVLIPFNDELKLALGAQFVQRLVIEYSGCQVLGNACSAMLTVIVVVAVLLLFVINLRLDRIVGAHDRQEVAAR